MLGSISFIKPRHFAEEILNQVDQRDKAGLEVDVGSGRARGDVPGSGAPGSEVLRQRTKGKMSREATRSLEPPAHHGARHGSEKEPDRRVRAESAVGNDVDRKHRGLRERLLMK